MCDSDGGAALRSSIKSRLNDFLRLGVEGAGSFVEQEDLGIAEKRASDGDLE
jgi:hypothetical protein